MFENNEKKNENLESVLYSLALNYTGIPEGNTVNYDLQKDLIKSLMDTLQFEITNSYSGVKELFQNCGSLNFKGAAEEKSVVFSKLNSLLLLDTHNLSQDSPIPGNIYEITDSKSPLYIKELSSKAGIIELDTHEDFKELKKRRICIEITPPCDFAQNKKQSLSRIVGGLQMDFNKDILKGGKSRFKGDNFYSFLYPVNIEGFEKPQMIIFDFYRFQTINECDLRDPQKYRILMKTKDKLFADVIQKLSSHTARLGLAVLYP